MNNWIFIFLTEQIICAAINFILALFAFESNDAGRYRAADIEYDEEMMRQITFNIIIKFVLCVSR